MTQNLSVLIFSDDRIWRCVFLYVHPNRLWVFLALISQIRAEPKELKKIINFNQNKLLRHVGNIIAASLFPKAHMMFSLPRNAPEQNFESLLRFLFHWTELWVVYSSTEWFGTEFREFATIFVPGTEFRAFFSSAEWFGTEFREFATIFVPGTEFRAFFSSSEWNSESFLFRGTAGITSELTICFVYSVVRGIVFCLKFPTPHATGIQFLRKKEWNIACSLLPQTSKN